jgi:phosphoribosyl 1,2-cyclic phosphodiesterase
MSVQFTVLGSGSSGNASLLNVDGFGILLDLGLGPRQIAARLKQAASSWETVRVVMLTHTHADHWNEKTFAYLSQQSIRLYCHADHLRALRQVSPSFGTLRASRMVRTYDGDALLLDYGIRCLPIRVIHDGGATFGFRFDGVGDLFTKPWSLAYVADLGSWNEDIVRALTDVDLLALEFNHDRELEHASARPRTIVDRVLGDRGHLSNEQAASLLAEVIRLSAAGRLQQVVQLHLSDECNRPTLAMAAVRRILGESGVAIQVHTAHSDRATPTIHVHRSTIS